MFLPPPPPPGPFRMPMFRDFVPRKLQPWIFVCFALTYQLSGGVYLTALNQMIGGQSLMREDITMSFYCSMVGLTMPFPILFRLKFRFTNRQMHLFYVSMIIICNLLAMHITSVPMLWVVCFVSGWFKICGTFECMSNIQLWITPKRDFTVFFPFLYIIVLGDVQLSSLITGYITYYHGWAYMHWLIVGLLTVMLVMMITLMRDFRFMKPFPLYSIDWLGGLLWALLLLEICFIFNYGEYYNWFTSSVIRQVTAAAVFTLYLCCARMNRIRHPYIEPAAWRTRNMAALLLLYLFTEMLISPPEVLQETFMDEVLGYSLIAKSNLYISAYIGIVTGCMFSLLWMNRLRYTYIKLVAVGFGCLVASQVIIYFLISPDISYYMFYLPTALRTAGYAMLYSALTVYMEEIMTFEHLFQGFCIVGMVRTGIGGPIGTACYAYGLRFTMMDNLQSLGATLDSVRVSALQLSPSRLIQQVQEQNIVLSIRQLYGITALAGVVLVLLVCLYDTPVRSTLKRIPSDWNVARRMKKTNKRNDKEVLLSKQTNGAEE